MHRKPTITVAKDAIQNPVKLESMPCLLMKEGKPTKAPVNPHMLTLNRPVSRPPTAPPIDAVMKTRPYLRLRPYIAGSVTPHMAEIVAGPASCLMRGFFDFTQMARAPAPWAIIVADTMALILDSPPPLGASWAAMIGMTAQCKPKMTSD